MADRSLERWPDAVLIDALRRVEPEIAWPVASTPAGQGHDLAATVRERIESLPTPAAGTFVPGRRWSFALAGWIARPTRRALLLAVALLIVLAAIAGAAGVGLPGLRVLFGGGEVSPPPSLEPDRSAAPGGRGAAMGLGEEVSASDPAAIDAQAGFHVQLPADPRAGSPDAAYVDETKHGQVSLVWATRADLPATFEPGVGLLMTEFVGFVDDAFYSKVVGSGTTVEAVLVDGKHGYWLAGEPHFFFYTGPGGVVRDDRRWVGDALVWSDGKVTYRLESALGQQASIEIAESLR